MNQKSLTASIALQTSPRGVDDKKVIEIVDKVIALIKKSGVNYEVGPMETTMEGELETLLDIVKKAQYLAIKAGAKSVFSYVKIHYNPKGVLTMAQKTTKHRKKSV